MSAAMPSRSKPRSCRPKVWAGGEGMRRMASSRVTPPAPRTYSPRTRALVPKHRGPAHSNEIVLHSERDRAARGRVGEPLLDLAAGQRPAGQADAEIGAGAIVGVLVGHHVDAFAAEFFDEGERLVAGAPHAVAVDLEMRNFHRHAGFLADVDGFGDGFQFMYALIAHVAGVDAAVGRGSLGERDHFSGVGVDAGHVFEAGGKA